MIQLLGGDCRDVLRTLPAESVHCVVTSPPYWGLRDYGTATWEGGAADCKHIKGEMRRGINLAKSVHSTRGGAIKCADVEDIPYGNICGECGARRIDNQLGLEPDFDTYIAAMVGVFREVRRVLRADGTLWLNLGDSYASTPPGTQRGVSASSTLHGVNSEQYLTTLDNSVGQKRNTIVGGLKPKDLCGIPWRVAFALQADGWWLRQDIIWSKPNPMPESVTDRCTKAHEYMFLISKSGRYYYDMEAIKEPTLSLDDYSHPSYRPNSLRIAREGRKEFQGKHEVSARMYSAAGRNKRSVWEVTTAPFSEAHFATFPPALIEPCIKAGCPKGGTVLDPFGGAGTTGLVADRLQRNAILIELNDGYNNMATRRLKDDAGMFAEVDDARQT